MLRVGISMREIDATDLGLYLRVLAQAAKHKKEKDDGSDAPAAGKGKGEVIELKRGYIDDFWG